MKNPSILVLATIVLMSLLAAIYWGFGPFYTGSSAAVLRVAVLHSLSGTMAASEAPVVDATLMAIDEINARGGVVGQKIAPIVVDGRSDPAHFAREAERLITQEKVAVIFGCWTSACRKAVKPVVEQHQHLLVYPLQYEGLEESANILYTGLTPNQQIIPALSWTAQHLGRRVYLVGSDYVFPRTANLIIREYASALGLDIVGERYLPLGAAEVETVLDDVARLRPEVLINTINGDSNFVFFTRFQARFEGSPGGAAPKILSFSLAEAEISHAPQAMQGQYAAWSYFQSLDNPVNRKFVTDFQAQYGKDRVIDDPMEAAYLGVQLWARAAEAAGSTKVGDVNRMLANQSILAPQGIVTTDAHNRHVWRNLRISRARSDGQFDVVWSSEMPIRPLPFPRYHTQTVWMRLLMVDQAGSH